jgi:hypothetical protein
MNETINTLQEEVKEMQTKLNEAENTLLDTISFENHEELDLSKEEYDLILNRYRKELTEMKLDEFIGCVVEDSYKLGYIRACVNAGLEIPQ